ncbi:unnamed protein product [Scytosiphon promiscuus]
MAWSLGSGYDDDIIPILRRSLEALLQRSRSFAQAFIQDRRTFERIIKFVLCAGHAQQQQSRRLERSACLHCIVLAFRLTHVDDFAAETAVPVLIAGALSGVVQYPASHEQPHEEEGQQQTPIPAWDDDGHNGLHHIENTWPSTPLSSAQELASHVVVNPSLEAIEDGAQSILEALEARWRYLPSGPSTPRGEDQQGVHTPRSTTSTMTPSSTYAVAYGGRGTECRGRTKDDDHANRVTAVTTSGEDFDDPATCGTFALRRLCTCGLGFALLPPSPETAVPANMAGALGKSINPRRKNAGQRSSGCQDVKAAAGTAGRPLCEKDGETARIASPRRGGKSICLVMSVSDLRKAQARSFGHAKRWARMVAASEASKPPPVAKRVVGLNDRMNGGGHDGRGVVRGAGRNGGGNKSVCEGRQTVPETADPSREREVERNNRSSFALATTLPNHGNRMPSAKAAPRHSFNVCPSCRIVVLGHPLDTISVRCGGVLVTRSSQGEQAPLGPASGAGKAFAYQAAKFGSLAAGTGNGWRQAGVTNQPKSTGGTGNAGAIAAEDTRGKLIPSVGVAAVSQARLAVETVAEQLGSIIQGRCSKHDAAVARLANLHARCKQAKALKLDRKIDFRRRLAAAADEARQETEAVGLRRRLSRGGTSDLETNRGTNGVDGDGTTAATGGAGASRAAPSAGHGLGDGSKRDADGGLVKPDPAAVAAAATGDASALSLARWNHQQEKEQVQRLQELIVETKHAINGGETKKRPSANKIGNPQRGEASSESGSSMLPRFVHPQKLTGIFRDLARGADAAHSAILSSMMVDGMDTRHYLKERRRTFNRVATQEGEERSAYLLQPSDVGKSGDLESSSTGGTTDWESTTELSSGAAGASANSSTSGTGRSGRDDSSVGTTDEVRLFPRVYGDMRYCTSRSRFSVVAGKKARAVARDAEELRLARARRAAKEERLQIEKREAIEAERGARRRAKDRAEAARNERKAKALARKEMHQRKEALDLQEERDRVEKEKSQEEHLIAVAAEKKRQSKLRRAREREKRKTAALEQARHEEEMARIERWRKEQNERATEKARQEEEENRVIEEKAKARLEASTSEEERRQVQVEAKRQSLKEEREVAAARLSRGEFR